MIMAKGIYSEFRWTNGQRHDTFWQKFKTKKYFEFLKYDNKSTLLYIQQRKDKTKCFQN